MKHLLRRVSAAALCALMLTGTAQAAVITPSAARVELAEDENTFTVDVSISEERAFAGMEFGVEVPDGVELTGVEFLDEEIQASSKTPQIARNGLEYFGFYRLENEFSGDYDVARLTFRYAGEEDVELKLAYSKLAIAEEDGSIQGDTTSNTFTVQVSRAESGGSSSSRYAITASAGEGGSISPSGAVRVERGDSQTFTIRAGEGYEISDVLADGRSVGAVSSYTFENVRERHTIRAVFTTQIEDPDTPLTDAPFTDVPADAWYAQPVQWAVENGITSGTGAGTFSPDMACTRAQIVTFLWQAAGRPQPAGSGNPFADVKESDYFYTAVLWAVEQGITAGVSEDSFAPYATVTRGQTVTFLYRAAGSPAVTEGGSFADVEDGAWYADAVAWAAAQGITAGVSADAFGPNASCTRAQIVTFLYRFAEQ